MFRSSPTGCIRGHSSTERSLAGLLAMAGCRPRGQHILAHQLFGIRSQHQYCRHVPDREGHVSGRASIGQFLSGLADVDRGCRVAPSRCLMIRHQILRRRIILTAAKTFSIYVVITKNPNIMVSRAIINNSAMDVAAPVDGHTGPDDWAPSA